MTVEQLKASIEQIMFSGKPFGLRFFACIRVEKKITLKEVQITDDLKHSIAAMLKKAAQVHFLSEETELEPADNISDNKNVLYEIEQADSYTPFSFLEQYKQVSDLYSEQDQDALAGFAFAVNQNESVIWFYQNIYAANLVKRSRILYAMLSKGSTYTVLDREIVRIEARIDITILGKSIITSKIDLLQKSFGFDEYVKREAHNAISQIADMGLLTDTAKIEDLINKARLTNAKRLMKVKNSPVLKMDKTVLFYRLSRHPRYKDKFKFQDGKVVIRTQKEASEFIKMLNDDIVRSELTNQEYDSPSKQMLKPLSA